jgi:hypothetical protein
LQVDFASTQSISEIDIFTLQDNFSAPVDPVLGMTFTLYGITAFQVQYWDGSTWSTVPGGNISGNNQVWRQFTFAPVATSHIRVWVTGALGNHSRITEVEAYADYPRVGNRSTGKSQPHYGSGGIRRFRKSGRRSRSFC